jgi:hypothetical protein
MFIETMDCFAKEKSGQFNRRKPLEHSERKYPIKRVETDKKTVTNVTKSENEIGKAVKREREGEGRRERDRRGEEQACPDDTE